MQVSLIGTGLMGTPMIERLLEMGYEVIAFNRTKAKLDPLKKLGAKMMRNASDAIQASSITILMVTDYAAIREMLSSSRDRSLLQDRTIVQMGTIAPSESRILAEKVAEEGGEYFEAPVLGSITEARAGRLLVMIGASESQFQRWKKLLSAFGPDPILIGPVGQAATVKLALNQLIASHITAFSLSLGLIQRSRVNVDDFMKILKKSALTAPMFERKLPRLRDRQYDNPNFPTTHLLKDVNLVIQEAISAGLLTTGLEGVQTLLEQTLDKGLRDVDYSSIFETIVPHKINPISPSEMPSQ